MGVMRFIVHPPELSFSRPEVCQAFLSGLDGRIFSAEVEFDGHLMLCRRPSPESAKVSIPWPVPEFGTPILTTTSLRDREEPYLLPLELARGKLSELRDQAFHWEMAGMSIPETFRVVQQNAFREFAKASSSQSQLKVACQHANNAIMRACQATAILMDSYVIQRMTSVRRSSHQTPGLLGCVLDQQVLTPSGKQHFLETFNTAVLPVRWKTIEPTEGDYDWSLIDQLLEFCIQNRVVMTGGPLIDLGPQGMPEWLSAWKNDLVNLPSFICDFIETAVSRYQGQIRHWEVSTAGNLGGALDLGEDHRLALVARTLEAARRTDNDAQYFIHIERSWGEYQQLGKHRLSPFQFVDAIVRSNLGLSGVTLDINIGYGSEACLARDMMSISKLIDAWSMLGIQIHINLACPSAAVRLADDTCRHCVEDHVWREQWSEEGQADWIEHIVPLLFAKPSVTGVFWDQFSDLAPHRFPNAGVIGPDGIPKKMMTSLQRQLHQDLA